MPTTPIRYAALLRGINVGGNKKVPMAQLKKAMEKAGYTNVKTLLASGNVIFDATEANATKLRTALETLLAKEFGFPIPVLIRTIDDIQKLIASDPFKGIKVTPETRLYITFLSEKPTSTLKIPYASPEGQFRILKASSTELCSVLVLDGGTRTVDLMNIVEKEFDKNVTTRNWKLAA